MDITTVVRQLRIQRDRAANEVQRPDAALAALGSSNNGIRIGGGENFVCGSAGKNRGS
ncbi:MAG TPA: hypothetical protein VMQ17_23810 [Candidatus Sulfotelmatobacter sp.]|nr:hypothetical protein [Candidatus Sulfotelmatobacter sp.]